MSIFSVLSSKTPTLDSKRGLALLGVLATFSLFGATGCAAEVHTGAVVATYPEPVVYEEPVVYVATVPVDIESHPRVYYRGSYVYYVDGRWYAPSPRGWVYYRSEPRALVRYRVEYERARPHVHTHVHARKYRPGRVIVHHN